MINHVKAEIFRPIFDISENILKSKYLTWLFNAFTLGFIFKEIGTAGRLF
jgi:hypothetical protein